MISELAPLDSPRVVYDIRRDAEGLKLKQEASLASGWGGLEITHGLIGTPEWWSAVEAGKFKVETFVGVLRSAAAGDVLHVHIEGESGAQRWMAWRGFDRALDGKKVRTVYVRMAPRHPLTTQPDFRARVLLQVEMVE
ncbi:MAG: hypothetical protein ABSG14_13915 [Verrucomicrobiia bacterium]|jgi:hypothetical protein